MGEPKAGEKYLHFKGMEIEVICVAMDCEDQDRRIVVYKQLYSDADFSEGTIWVRSLENFCGEKELDNGNKVMRFRLE